MKKLRRLSQRKRLFRRNTLAGALALAFLGGGWGLGHAAPVARLGPPFKLNGSPSPERILSLDVDMNNLGAGVALWQRRNEDGRYATYFRRFDRFGTVFSLQTHELTTTLNPAKLLKVFDNGEFAIENRRGSTVKILIRSKTGGVARTLTDIQCKTVGCRVAMDDEGDMVVVDGSQPIASGYRHAVAQLHDRTGKVVKPWFVVDQPLAGMISVDLPNVAVDADGDFVAGWNPHINFEDAYSPFANNFVLIRQFQKTGLPKGNQFIDRAIVNGDPVLATDADGDFIVSGGGSNYNGWFGGWSLYRKTGARVAQSGPIFEFTRHDTVEHKVAMDDDGDYVRNFTANYEPIGAGYIFDAEAKFSLYRGFSLSQLGSRTVADFSVRPAFFDHRILSDVAMDGKGNITALWVQPQGDAGDPLGLFLQRFTGPLGEGCGGAGATLVGTDAANTINGTAGDDVIHGKGGNDVIHGNGGNDVICGGAGLDRLFGDAGLDRLFGDSGADQMYGGDGNDSLNGGADVDFADGGLGGDTCVAESVMNCP